jgi:MerR family transcriptional regulator, heat shock protein HspR
VSKKLSGGVKMNEKNTDQSSGMSATAIAEKKELYTINEVAALLGVHQQTLRNWERKKLVIPMRVGTRRIYTQKHIEFCKKIREFSGKGVSLKGIKELLKNI